MNELDALARWLNHNLDVSGFPMPIEFRFEVKDGYLQMILKSNVKDRDDPSKDTHFFTLHEIRAIDAPEWYRDACKLIPWIYKAIHEHVRHEVDECFKVCGMRIYDPHERWEATQNHGRWEAKFPTIELGAA